MLRFLFAFIVLAHGLIHLMGFAKAFNYGNITQLTKDISKPTGMLWLLAGVLCMATVVLVVLKKDWWLIGLAALALSQALIFSAWHDAKFGTIANAIMLVAAGLAFSAWRFEQTYINDVQAGLARTRNLDAGVLTERDIQHLPAPVQRYLTYAGVLNKPKINRMRIVFTGEMRDRGKDWFTFQSEQHNFFDEPTRLFFMKGQFFGITVPGYHAYKNGSAAMQIKLFGLFPIVDVKGNELAKAETVTVFNDMCLMAPATLIDPRIQWEAIDNISAKAVFTNHGIRISAILQIDDQGRLTNFISDDRYAISDMKQYRFSTPLRDYKNFNGYNVGTYGEAVWHYPEGEFVYGKFNLKEISYD